MRITSAWKRQFSFQKPPERGYRPPTKRQIQALEDRLGRLLPDDYRRFLLKYAGWWINAEYPVQGDCLTGDTQGIEVFYTVDSNDTNDIWEKYVGFLDRLSPWWLPIGHDAMGNLVVLSLHAKELGTVRFYDRSEEECPGGAAQRDRGLFLIARSFTGFLEALQPVELDDEEDEAEEEQDPEHAEILNRLLTPGLPSEEHDALIARLTKLARRKKKR